MRKVEDKDYIECLTPLYRKRYYTWKQKMLLNIDVIVEAFSVAPAADVMKQLSLSPRDVALLVRLKYLTEEETERFNLRPIEQSVPE